LSDFFAEAEVLIRPNTAGFRPALEAELLAATRGLTVPVSVIPTTTGAGLGAVQAEARKTTAALDSVRNAELAGIAASRDASRAAAVHAKQLGQLEKGALAASLSFTGLRGAVLAASAPFLLATVAVTAFARGIQQAASFERELNVFQVTARATADEMERVREESRALGRDISLPGVSAADAAQSMTELAKAGLDVEQSLAGARGVLQLATAAQISNAEATELAANALNAFNLSGDQTIHVADLLANAANESQGSILDMGIALRQSAAVGRQLGLSLDETVTMLTILARAGLAGSDAGTSLRVALTRLIAPTGDAAEELDKLNVSLRDAQGNLRPDVFVQIGEAMADLGKQEQARVLFEIFGQDAQRAAAILAREGLPALQEMTLALQRQGAAAEIAGARTEGFSGKLEGLGSELETVGTNLEFLLIPLGGVVDLFRALAEGINSSFDFLRKLGKEIDQASKPAVNFAGRIKDASDRTDAFVGNLLRGIPGIDRAADALDKLGSDAPNRIAQVQELSSRFEEQGSVLADNAKFLDEIITRLGRLPTDAEVVRITLDPSQARSALKEVVDDARENGTLSAEALAEAFRRESQASAGTLTEPLRRGLSDFQAEAGAQGQAAGEAFIRGFNDAQVRGQLQAQKTAVAQAQAFGETGLEELQAELDRIDRILASKRRPTGPALESLFNERMAVINEIRSIQERAASETKAAADDVRRARDEQDQAILDAIGLEEQRRQNAIISAQSDEALQNDLQAQISLRNFYRSALAEVRKTVQDAQTKAQAIAGLTQDLIRANQAIRHTREQLREQRQQERRDRIRERQEGLELDLQIAQATGNVGAQRRALQAEIKFYQERIRATRAGSNQRKRWILELRRAQAELRELKGEGAKTQAAFKELAFEFLTTQQGFAANLFGNLIPTSATGNLVSPGAAAQPASRVNQAAALAQTQQGFSKSEVATELDLLRMMLAELKAIRSGKAFPEATYQRHQTAGTMETQ